MKTATGLLLSAVLLAGCIGSSSPLSQGDASSRALAVVHDLSQHRWDAVTAQFDDTMRKGLSPIQLDQVWVGVEMSRGPYKSHSAPEVVYRGDLAVVDIATTFGSAQMDCRVTFDPDGKIAGFYLLNM